jgi:hypothetical protein
VDFIQPSRDSERCLEQTSTGVCHPLVQSFKPTAKATAQHQSWNHREQRARLVGRSPTPWSGQARTSRPGSGAAGRAKDPATSAPILIDGQRHDIPDAATFDRPGRRWLHWQAHAGLEAQRSGAGVRCCCSRTFGASTTRSPWEGTHGYRNREVVRPRPGRMGSQVSLNGLITASGEVLGQRYGRTR